MGGGQTTKSIVWPVVSNHVVEELECPLGKDERVEEQQRSSRQTRWVLRTKRTRTDRTQVQRVILPKKGSMVATVLHRGECRTCPTGRRAKPANVGGWRCPTFGSYQDHFSLQLLRHDHVRPRARPFNAFKAVESSFSPLPAL